LVRRALKEVLESPDRLDPLEPLAPRATLAWPDPTGSQDSRAPLDRLETQDQQVLLASRAP